MHHYAAKVRELLRKTLTYTPKAYVLTFGCQQNEADSERMLGAAISMGYDPALSPEDADLILVNTCAIREHAEKRALSIIGQFKHLKAKNPQLIIGVGGCMTAQKHRLDQLKHSYPYVDIVFGTASIHRIPEMVYGVLTSGRRTFRDTDTGSSDFQTVAEGIPVRRASPSRAWVSIMYGCNNFCSYCIVPYVRGRERSRRPEEILAEVQTLVADGCRDITLLGQNVNSYGRGLDIETDIADLIRAVDSIAGDFRIRFMTSHPKDASEKLIQTMASCEKAARHFHLPMQSGSDEILRRMNRRYDAARYLSIVEALRRAMPEIAITSDIIVGFPGETEDDFEATLEALRRAEFDMIYSFLFSPRKGTPAAEMECQVPEEIKSARFTRLLETQNEISRKKNEAYIGRTVRVLSEGASKNDPAMYTGRTSGAKLVHFPDGADTEGTFVEIKIDRADTFTLYGSRVI